VSIIPDQKGAIPDSIRPKEPGDAGANSVCSRFGPVAPTAFTRVGRNNGPSSCGGPAP
jgi:hypothetical protein